MEEHEELFLKILRMKVEFPQVEYGSTKRQESLVFSRHIQVELTWKRWTFPCKEAALLAREMTRYPFQHVFLIHLPPK